MTKILTLLALTTAINACSIKQETTMIKPENSGFKDILNNKKAMHVDVLYGKNYFDINNDGTQDLITKTRTDDADYGYDEYSIFIKVDGEFVKDSQKISFRTFENSECVTHSYSFEQDSNDDFLIHEFSGKDKDLETNTQDIYKTTYKVKANIFEVAGFKPFYLNEDSMQKLNTKYCDVNLILEKQKNKYSK